jgi:subtilisin
MGKNSVKMKYTMPPAVLAVLSILSLISVGSITFNIPPLHSSYAQSATSATPGNIAAPLADANITKQIGKIIPNEWIVTLRDNATVTPQASNSSIKALSDEAENRGVQVTSSLPEIGVFVVNTPPGGVSALADVQEDPNVQSVEPAVVQGILDQSAPTGIQRIDAQPTTNTTTTTMTNQGNSTGKSTNATIGIIDTGIYLNHPDLNVVNSVSFVPGTTNGNDDNGHGTHVAGIAAAKDNNIGVVGVAPGAKLWAIKVLDKDGVGSSAAVLSGIDFATAHAKELDVINLSLGGGFSVAENTAIRRAAERGLAVVVAAGNSHQDASSFSPASAPEAITVSAAADSDGKCGGFGIPTTRGRDDSFSAFSNYGKIVDIMAPGVNINSTWKDGGYKAISGTSMASPHVAGAAALYKSVHHSATPEQVLDALLSAASTPTTICKTGANGHGYLVDRSLDLDDVEEPLLDTQVLVDRR